MEKLEELAKILQNELAEAEHKATKKSRGFEIPIYKMQPLTIRMEPDQNHKRPHVHVDYGKEKHAASFAIDNGSILAGELPNRQEKIVKNWVTTYSEVLNRIWNTLQAGKDASHHIIKLNEAGEVSGGEDGVENSKK